MDDQALGQFTLKKKKKKKNMAKFYFLHFRVIKPNKKTN